MQALELAKHVYKAEPTSGNRDVLYDTYLGRSRQLRAQGKLRDAVTVLQVVATLNLTDPTRIAQLAQELAACGETLQALKLIQPIPGCSAQAQVLAQAADAALRQEAPGRKLLPGELHADFDRVLRAFAELESGQDEAARETLQGIGLRSPFLEWKLLLRGLQAYYQGEDARAIENWQRLSPERLPARLAAPLRFRIDPGYRTAQPPALQTTLQQQADGLQHHGLVPHLRAIQASLAANEGLGQGFRHAAILLPHLRAQAPQLVSRLARCFYWAIVTAGGPDDVPRYLTHFGPPPDDPTCDRLRALAYEHFHDLPSAHKHWQKYVEAVEANPTAWRDDQAKRVRALVWLHMGRNAAAVPDAEQMRALPRFLRNQIDRPPSLKPSAEKCLQNSLKLAPDLLEAHVALFEHHRDRHESEKAEKAAHQLLERFPDHAPVLDGLAALLMEQERYPEALELLKRALKGRPLDRELRAKIGTAHTYNARSLAEARRFDEARAEYQAALALKEHRDDSAVLCKWAACEFKAGSSARAEELLEQALQHSGIRLSVAYSMLLETIRLKLPAPLKTRFNREFNAALAEPPTGAGAAALADTAATHLAAGVTYHGQKTHEKKVLAYLEKARKADFTEEQLARVCMSLLTLKAVRPLRAFCQLGQSRFLKAAVFPYVEAESYFVHGPEQSYNAWRAEPMLEKAHRLTSEMPHDDKRKNLLEAIEQRQKILQVFGRGPMGFLDNLFEMGGLDPEDLDLDDEDDDDW
jgi:tetratricopeptide (TPR) repeat protein